MNHKHRNPRPERRATSTYNFVRLPEVDEILYEDELPSHENYAEGNYTGWIDCDLLTKTPIYTRTAVRPDFFEKWNETERAKMMADPNASKEYGQFFHYEDIETPYIPGSSLRGMVRSVMEIIGYSKTQWVSDKKLIYRAVGGRSDYYRRMFIPAQKIVDNDLPTTSIHGGFIKIEGSEHFIQPGEEHNSTSWIRVDEVVIAQSGLGIKTNKAVKVSVQIDPRSKMRAKAVIERDDIPSPEGYIPAWLIFSGRMSGKHTHYVIFDSDVANNGKRENWVKIPDAMWNLYKGDCEIHRTVLPRNLDQNNEPVFYMLDSNQNLIFFGTTMMFRIPYPNSPFELIPDEVKNQERIDFAEGMFGFVRESPLEMKIGNQDCRTKSYASRISFSDAKLKYTNSEQGTYYSSQIDHSRAPFSIPKILSGPKPTSYQLYLTQDAPNNERTLKTYANEKEQVTIRGNKFYWHKHESQNLEFEEPNLIDWKNDTQHTIIRPVKEGITFTFRIHFKNLSKVELGLLLWSLALPVQNLPAGIEYCHKLGMGKPYGLGSVKLTPHLFLSDRKIRYRTLFSEEMRYWSDDPNTKTKEDSQEEFFTAFVEKMLTHLPRTGRRSFEEQPRIQDLLTMLCFPGPVEAHYQSMQMGGGGQNINEFRSRKVLPYPQMVLDHIDEEPVVIPTLPATQAAVSTSTNDEGNSQPSSDLANEFMRTLNKRQGRNEE